MRVMEMAVDKIVDVIAMGDGRMAAVRPVDVSGIVARALMIWRAVDRVLRAHLERVLFDFAVLAEVMQMSVMGVVNVVAMLDRRVSAAWPVLMRVSLVMIVLSHDRLPRGLQNRMCALRDRMRSG